VQISVKAVTSLKGFNKVSDGSVDFHVDLSSFSIYEAGSETSSFNLNEVIDVI